MEQNPSSALPLGPARLVRPSTIRRLTFEDLLHRHRHFEQAALEIVPIEAARPGDAQVLAAHEPFKSNSPRINLDGLADVDSVQSVVASTVVRTRRELPEIRELLMSRMTLLPDAASISNLPGIESFFAEFPPSDVQLAVDRLPAHSLRRLAVARWVMGGLAPLSRFSGLEQLLIHAYPSDSLEPVSELLGLRYLKVLGPGKAWASLRRCAHLEEAHLVDVKIANLRRWNTWTGLRHLTLAGRGLKSLDGIEAFEQLETLTLINLGTGDLSPLGGLPRLAEVTLRMMHRCRNVKPLASLPALRRLEIEESVITERDVFHLDTIKPLAAAPALEEIVLLGTAIDDGDLSPLAEIPRLRRVKLDWRTGGDVEKLCRVRPDLVVDFFPSPMTSSAPQERVGSVTIHPPSDGTAQWSIFDNLAEVLGVKTNYDAEQRVRRAIKKINPEVLRQIEFDTEAGAVGIYAKTEAEIRVVASIVDELVRRDPTHSGSQ